MACWSIGLLLATCITSATADTIRDIDWVTAARANMSIPKTGPDESSHHISKRSSRYETPYGVFRHWSSGKYIHMKIDMGVTCPRNGVIMHIVDGIRHDGSMSFKFVQVTGHYGYLKHTCGKIVHPENGNWHPRDNTRVKVHSHSHAGALWTIDKENMAVIHRYGRRFYPRGGSLYPSTPTEIVLHKTIDDTSKFEFLDPKTLKPIKVFNTPVLSGHWEIIYAVINPMAKHTYEISYTVGQSSTTSTSSANEWKVSAGVSFSWFQASVEYRKFAEETKSTTWNKETTRTFTISVSPGQTVVTWQYFFEAKQFGDGLQFRSTILADTDNINIRPDHL